VQSNTIENIQGQNLPNKLFLSPLRYPGGKSWLVSTIRKWLNFYDAKKKGMKLAEPFLGGGIISLSALADEICSGVIAAEIDPDIAAVWETVLSDKNEWLANRISNFQFNIAEVTGVINTQSLKVEEIAFKTILRNRISRGGIIAPGAGKLKNGESSKGLASRWYAETLSNRIRSITKYNHKLKFYQGDGMQLIDNLLGREDILYFIDPPYPNVGERLYKYHILDHTNLFEKMSNTASPVLMTYNDLGEIRELARKYNFECVEIEMKTTHHKKRKELLITKSTEWM
jgi:DNA adenine methylase